MPDPITGAGRDHDGHLTTTCHCGWTSPPGVRSALVALREHQADTGHRPRLEERT